MPQQLLLLPLPQKLLLLCQSVVGLQFLPVLLPHPPVHLVETDRVHAAAARCTGAAARMPTQPPRPVPKPLQLLRKRRHFLLPVQLLQEAARARGEGTGVEPRLGMKV